MTDYHVGCGLFGDIYAGTFLPQKADKPPIWRNKTVVTQEAICAVRDHILSECINEEKGKTQGGYEWAYKDGKKITLIVQVFNDNEMDGAHKKHEDAET